MALAYQVVAQSKLEYIINIVWSNLITSLTFISIGTIAVSAVVSIEIADSY